EFSRLPTYLRTLSFFHIWTQKEAFIKACGMGLSYPTQVFHVPVKPPTSNDRIYDPKHQRNWHMQSFMPAPACCAAVCHHPNIQTIRYKKLSRDQHVIE
ncbi:MAG TPA: 4'-phosphopantetheinyl transferase superfamily protein, partial [Legionellaceae bacterium]|nr:4'-phosphopantetheinyl transferase superfamily protein [Legionellaceae bacterium]